MKDIGLQLTDGGQNDIDLKIEVKRDDNGLITEGLLVGASMNQNQFLMLIANPGEFKFNPTLGVAIDDLLLDNDYLRFRQKIKLQFKKDGLRVKTIQLTEGKPLLIDAVYE